MPVDELRHTLSDASAAVEALSRRLDGRLDAGEERLVGHVRSTIRRFEEVIDALIAYERATEPIDEVPVPLDEIVDPRSISTPTSSSQATTSTWTNSRPFLVTDRYCSRCSVP